MADPVDTTDDPEREARWQALVQEVVDAKAALDSTRVRLHQAQLAAGEAARDDRPLTAAEAKALNEAVADRQAAVERIERAQAAMKAGEGV